MLRVGGSAAAARFGVGISTAIRWIARSRLGETTARVRARRRTSRLDAHEAFIVELIEERRDITLNEMMARLSGERSVIIGHITLSAWLRGWGWMFKKVRHALEQECPDVLKRRRDWFEVQPDAHAAQDVRDEVEGLEGGGIAPVGSLVLGGAVDIVEYGTRQLLLGQQTEIVEVVAVRDMHPGTLRCTHLLRPTPRGTPRIGRARLAATSCRSWRLGMR